MQNKSMCGFDLLIGALVVCFLAIPSAGQTLAQVPTPSVGESERAADLLVPPGSNKDRVSDSERINALEEALRQQATQLAEMRKLLLEQQDMMKLLAGKLPGVGPDSAREDLAVAAKRSSEVGSVGITAEPQAPSIEDRLKKVEGRVSEIGAIKFSGDIRLRFEPFFGLSNSLPNAANPAVLGNELSPRHRSRIRARLAMRGQISEEFEWGMRLATGSFADTISTNQTLTDFFNRKPFSLDQAFVTYKPKKVPGLRLQGGKFEPPWIFTEMTFDNDLMVEGLNESYSRDFKGTLKNIALVAWQLPMLERNSAFVRNADGTVSVDQSNRAGSDLALYGAQLRTRFEPSNKVALTLSAADHYFSGTQFINPVQVVGSQLQLPLTFTIPATATTPAQTITTQVSIPRDLLVAGNANLGVSIASNNATNRDGRLSSGYNLVDLMGRLELKHNKRFPVTMILNFVTNTQTHDVVTAGPGGADLILRNNESNGYWAEVQVGKTRERGDILFGYTFLRIEKDAVLTPFNYSDVTQQSDIRAQRFVFSYAADPRVTFSLTGIFTARPNGVLGAFGNTPPGSLNRATTRLQFDTVIRF